MPEGKASPVAIELCELRYLGGEFRRYNVIVARVNTLSFRRKPGPPKMEVTVASVKNKGAGNGPWQSLKGGIKGLAVNLLIDPLTVETVGHRAMLDFGQALASGAATFTFPQATNVIMSSVSRAASMKRKIEDMVKDTEQAAVLVLVYMSQAHLFDGGPHRPSQSAN